MKGDNKIILCHEAMLEVANHWLNVKLMQAPKAIKVTYSPKTKMFTIHTTWK